MERFKIIGKDRINELPKTSGVYCFYELNPNPSTLNPIYIGKAINIQNRVKNHFNQPSYRDDLFMSKVDKIGFFETNSEIEALILEANLIKRYQPKFNVVWRDDKNYFYVAIARNKNGVPFVYITHQPSFAKASEGQGHQYVGPFIEGVALKNTLKYLRRVFPYYTVKNHPKNKCTYCHLGLCPGPDPDLVEYRKNINKLILILRGKRKKVLYSLKKEMSQLSKESKFEQASIIRDRISSLQQVMSHSNVIENSSFNLSGRVECYDVSNIQGKLATGSMVVSVDGKLDRNEYRKFKIKMKNEPNDIAMLKEVISRRLNHPEWAYPDVMLIDGGKAQLNVAINSKSQTPNPKQTQNIKIISIAKGRQELFIEGKASPIPLKKLPQEIYNLIKQLDDEAHRFAITYHKKLRKNSLLKNFQ